MLWSLYRPRPLRFLCFDFVLLCLGLVAVEAVAKVVDVGDAVPFVDRAAVGTAIGGRDGTGRTGGRARGEGRGLAVREINAGTTAQSRIGVPYISSEPMSSWPTATACSLPSAMMAC